MGKTLKIKTLVHKIMQSHHKQSILICMLIGLVLLGSALIAKTSVEKQEIHGQAAVVQSANHNSVQKVTPEANLNTVFITENAYQKLGIQVTSIKSETVSQVKNFGGEIMVPTGKRITLSAPVSGKLLSTGSSAFTAGATVEQGQILFSLEPQLTPDARASLLTAVADVESQVNTSQTQLEASKIALERAKKLLQDLVGSQRNVDEANAAYEIALRNAEAARSKSVLIQQMMNAGNVAPLEIKAPQSGIITNVLALPHQVLTSGTPIMEISALDTLWIRVPVPSAELKSIDLQSEARVSHLANADNAYQMAKHIDAPPTADPLTGTVNLMYTIPNLKAAYQPGQRVSVTLKAANKDLRALRQAIVVPWSSIVTDLNGDNWGYLMITETEFKRVRVFVDYVAGPSAVLSDGLNEYIGANIVTNGALELFAVETGFIH